MKCDKCSKTNFKEWEKGITYEGIDKHHNPPEEISRFLKEKWSGEFCFLCRNCHQKLHQEITKILKKYSLKPNYNSDYWLMLHSTKEKLLMAKEKIYSFTNEWLKKDDTNTPKITR